MPPTARARRRHLHLRTPDDELIKVEDDFGGRASPADYIESFEAFVRANMNAVPAMIAATQRPRELTRKELKELAILLDDRRASPKPASAVPMAGRAMPTSPRISSALSARPRLAIRWCPTKPASKTACSGFGEPDPGPKSRSSGSTASGGR
jgi:hypothetical protein